MLEPTDYDYLDHTFPSLGAITDVMCKNENEATLAKLFTEYAEHSH